MQHHPRKSPEKLTTEQLEKLRVAVFLAGGAAKVARAMGYKTSESVRRFTTGLKLVPPERVTAFVEAVGGRLTAADVRPDLHRAFAAAAEGARRRGGARA